MTVEESAGAQQERRGDPLRLDSPDGGGDAWGEPRLVRDHDATIPSPRRQRVPVGRGRWWRRVIRQVVERPDLEHVDRRERGAQRGRQVRAWCGADRDRGDACRRWLAGLGAQR